MSHSQRSERAQFRELENQLVSLSYQSIDPWAPSIYQSIHNRRLNSIQDIDDVGLPFMLPHPIFLRQHQPQSTPSIPSDRQASQPIPRRTLIPQQRRRQVGSATSIHHTTPLQVLPHAPPPRPSLSVHPPVHDLEDNYDSDAPRLPPSLTVPRVSGSGMFGPRSPPSSAVNLPETGEVRAPQLDRDLSAISVQKRLRPTSSTQIPRFTDQESLEPGDYVFAFLSDTLPRQIYLHCLLRLPSLYFSRVDRIFTDADLTLGEIKDMALCATVEDSATLYTQMLNFGYDVQPEAATDFLPPSYRRLKDGWESFIDNLIKEWKTLNIVSGLLVAAILTLFQIDSAFNDIVTRYIAIWSLLCALISLLYGCSFIIRFSPMRRAHKAAEWAVEARKHQTIVWNVWVMLALPVIWLAWSIITFILCIMTFMWRSSAAAPTDLTSIAPSAEFYFRIFISVVLGVGIVYGTLISITFRKYGDNMDQAWKKRVNGFIVRAVSLPQYLQPQPVPAHSKAHASLAKSKRALRRTRGPPENVRPGWRPVNTPQPDHAQPAPPPLRRPVSSVNSQWDLPEVQMEPPSRSEPGPTTPNPSSQVSLQAPVPGVTHTPSQNNTLEGPPASSPITRHQTDIKQLEKHPLLHRPVTVEDGIGVENEDTQVENSDPAIPGPAPTTPHKPDNEQHGKRQLLQGSVTAKDEVDTEDTKGTQVPDNLIPVIEGVTSDSLIETVTPTEGDRGEGTPELPGVENTQPPVVNDENGDPDLWRGPPVGRSGDVPVTFKDLVDDQAFNEILQAALGAIRGSPVSQPSEQE